MVARLCCRTLLVGLIGITLVGCSKPKRPAAKRSPYPGPRVLALTLAANQSGVETLEPRAVTEAFFSELQQVRGFQIVPVNRTLAAMAALELDRLSSPAQAMQLAEALGADGIIATAVTQYDPYFPPHVGLIVQLYDRQSRLSGTGPRTRDLDPIELTRQPRPFEIEPSDAPSPTTTVVRIVDVDQDEVVAAVQRYAADRSGRDRPAGWKNYTRGRNFLRFAAHEMIAQLLDLEQARLRAEAPPPEPEPQPERYDGP